MNTLKTKSSKKSVIRSMTIAAALAATMITGSIAAPSAALADNDRGKGYKKEHVTSADMHHRHHKKQYKKRYQDHKHVHKKHRKHKHHRGHHVHDKHRRHDHGYHRHGKHSHRHDTRMIRYYHLHDHGYNHHHGFDPRISLGLHLGHFDLYFEDY